MLQATCYRCPAPASSREHCPPRALFPRGHRHNLLTVPSCEEHNGRKSQDDEYLAYVVAVHHQSNAFAEDCQKRLFRAITRRPSLGKKIFHDISPVELEGVETGAFSVDMGRLNRGLEAIVAGLYFRDQGRPMRHVPRVHTDAFYWKDDKSALVRDPDMDALQAIVDQGLQSAPLKSENPDVFWYRSMYQPDGRFVMQMKFFRGLTVAALADAPPA